MTPLAALLGIELNPTTGQANLAATNMPTASVADVDDNVNAFAGPGRSSDPDLRFAVENRALKLAKDHMKQLGWDEIEKLGKPYDLVCRGQGSEKHVEVKGTTGAGGTVEYTTNEVEHFRSCPHGADLIVVREIRVDRTTLPYGASGGVLVHIENYRAPQEDLQPVKYQGRVHW